MDSQIIGMLAETAVHPGAGRSVGFVDLPVAREAVTDYPVIPGSGLKGALRQAARDSGWSEDCTKGVFGQPDNAGGLVVSDARLALLPVRSLNSQYKWITCPHLLERLERDMRRSVRTANGPGEMPSVEDGKAYAGAGDDTLFLEERQFEVTDQLPDGVVDKLRKLVPHASTGERLEDQTVVLSNDDFRWFASYGLAVNARNNLDKKTKESKNLWYEESLPPDSLFYCLLSPRKGGRTDGLKEVRKLLGGDRAYLQVGGNETIGQGWFAIQWLGEEAGE